MVLTKKRRVFTPEKERTIIKSLGFKKKTQKKIFKSLDIVPKKKPKSMNTDSDFQRVKVTVNIKQPKSISRPSKPKAKKGFSIFDL